MPEDRMTGKGQSFVFNGVTIPITKVSPALNRTVVDNTDSANYDSGSDMVHRSQMPVTLQTDLAVEGRFRKGTVASAILAQLYSGNNSVVATYKLNPSLTFLTGNFDITDFKMDAPLEDMITYSATMKSNGVVTPSGGS